MEPIAEYEWTELCGMTIFPNRADAVIFDMDGLLFDTERVYVTAIVGAGRAVGFDISEPFCHAMIGIPPKECDTIIQEHFGPAFPMADFAMKCSALITSLIEAGVPLKPGVVELIDLLSGRNIPMAVATSSTRQTAMHYLRKAGLLERFDLVVTRDEVAHGKPRPDLFIKAAESLRIEPRHCLSLEDSHNGIRSAYAAKTMPIMVPDIVPPTGEIRAMCVAVVDSLHDVCRLMAAQDHYV